MKLLYKESSLSIYTNKEDFFICDQCGLPDSSKNDAIIFKEGDESLKYHKNCIKEKLSLFNIFLDEDTMNKINANREKYFKLIKEPLKIPGLPQFTKPLAEIKFSNGRILVKHPYQPDLNKKYKFLNSFKFDRELKGWELTKLNDIETFNFLLNLNQEYPQYYWKLDKEAKEFLKEETKRFYKDKEDFLELKRIKSSKNSKIEFEDLKVDPFNFQKVGYEFINYNEGVAMIGDSMGLGKTMQAISYAVKNDLKVVVVVPASLKYTWKSEVEKFSDKTATVLSEYDAKKPIEIDSDFIIVNYEQLSKYEKFLSKHKHDLVILDESHYIKNTKSIRYKMVKKLFKKTKHRLLLSGTPINNRPMEFYSQLNFLRPDLFKSKERFGLRYCDAQENTYGRGFIYDGASNLRELYSKINSFYIRRNKKEVLTELPEKTRTLLEIDLSAEKRREYNKLFKEVAEEGLSLAGITQLKQLLAKNKIAKVEEFIASLIEEDNDRKVIVFSQYKETQDMLLKMFPKQTSSILAGHSPLRRQKEVEEFQKDPSKRVFVGSTLAAGVGITLTAADVVIFLDLMWSPSHHDQGEDRALRIGQKNHVNVYYFLAHNTIENGLWADLEKKREIISETTEEDPDRILQDIKDSLKIV
jgi:SWI/SNF-related matrix-associated actin-dependent regulator of chromatin subfamily A-like protein 1